MTFEALDRAFLRFGPGLVVGLLLLGAWFWSSRPSGAPPQPAQARSAATPQSAAAP